MSKFPKTDYARARRQVHELAWQEYLKTQQPAVKSQSKTERTVTKLQFWETF